MNLPDPAAGVAMPTGFGLAELVPDATAPGAWTLTVDGVPQSYVDVGDPTRMKFDYMRRLVTVVDTAAEPGAPLRVLHLGGGALSLPRFVAATRPGSVQTVVDRDELLMALIWERLPLPEDAGVTVLLGDARETLESLPDDEFDLVVADVYQAARMPRSIAGTGFVREASRVLRPDGLLAVNVVDVPPLARTRVLAATLAAVLPDVCVIGEAGMLRGRKYGNTVLVAGMSERRIPVDRLAALAERDPEPGRVIGGDALAGFTGGAAPLDDPIVTG
ncbi:spermidine synthase [Catenuloplanes atrovinosus]|uniref:Spermidine synthase n=1 Tax=Catenuloplanes atrovinosus TaxID=137266 RepID=A0AAE3YM01_9ACTN|nr:fused MFS/spermidine synthase [Catenuloplanes atrovinosus]MDR7274952.1 spermidine synthase [Catenuloplanes atrovinosus]